jgi:hypothetical protein
MTRNQNVNLDITPNFLNYFKYAPITSVIDIDHTFHYNIIFILQTYF